MHWQLSKKKADLAWTKDILDTNNMDTMDLSFCNKLLLVIEKKIIKIKKSSDFNEIFSVHRWIYNASVILFKKFQIFSDHLILSPPCVWSYLIGRDIWCGIYFLCIMKRQKSKRCE